MEISLTTTKFLTDVMLLKLGRWLRILGVSTEFPADSDDDSLLFQAKSENLVLLTMDENLSKRAEKLGIKSFLIPHDKVSIADQLSLLVKRFKLPIKDFEERTLCTKCGGDLEIVDASEVKAKVPADIPKRFKAVWRCKKCGQIYWKGGHWREIRKIVKSLKALKAKK